MNNKGNIGNIIIKIYANRYCMYQYYSITYMKVNYVKNNI